VTFVDYENPFALVNKSSGTAPHIAKLSRHDWVGCGGDIYVLECMGKGHVRIEPVAREDGKIDSSTADSSQRALIGSGTIYRAHFAPAMGLAFKIATKFAPFQQKRHILDAETVADAVRGCDTYAMTKILKGPLVLGQVKRLSAVLMILTFGRLLRSARWRHDPATDNQKSWIRKRWGGAAEKELGEDASDSKFPDRIAKLTKGEAANIITRLKHGALVCAVLSPVTHL